jgi:Flp pilus assembly protein TadG
MILHALRRRRRREDGAALVEFALILPVLVLLLFGLIDFGFIYNDYLQVRQGVRDGARQGAVANFGTTTSCNGFAPASTSTQAQALICTTRGLIGLDAPKMRVAVCVANNSATTCDSTVPPNPSYAAGNKLVVCAMYPATSRTGFLNQFLSNGVVTTRVVIRIEQTASTASGGSVTDNLTTLMENLSGTGFPSGKNWNFCKPSD